ncbi:TonB-dependent receptor [Gammaproteobacteria bacterium]|nr:TonB-dependent receptor [Gammaproteobacteria bacterium]MDC0919005.1 TonB-dependent receptor [Gammaproteobacteria bacterium]
MKTNKFALLFMGAVTINALLANDMEEVIVSSSLIDQAASEIPNPLHVMSGNDISNNASKSLGETLNDLLGVSSSDYGSGVGQPIIRGMSGSRVKILDNGLVNRDVSGLGADHINDVDLSNVQQIEVVRGPSSLLYTNGTIGGIVNIVDNSIAQEDVQRLAKIGLETQSVNDGDAQTIFYQDNLNDINISFSYKDSSFGDFNVPNGSIIHIEEEGHQEHGDHEEHDEQEEELGYLVNSDFASESLKFGASKTGDWGYIGFSLANIESLYGIPYHGDEHDEHDEHEDEEEVHEEHEGERIFSTTDSDKFDLRGSLNINGNFLSSVDFFFRDSDYVLTEQHAQEDEEHDEHEGHSKGSTTFANDSVEAGLIFDLSNDQLSQKVSLNFVNEDNSVRGAEAFMNPASRDELTLGYFASRDFDVFHVDFGIRFDNIDSEGSVSSAHEENNEKNEGHDEDHEEMETSFFDKSFSNSSLAFNFSKSLNDFIDLDIGFASVERAPSAVELFMNGAHLATGRFEVGNANLNSEKSNNIDFTLNFNYDNFFASATVFNNDVDNYIYLKDETEEEHEEHDENHEEGHDEHASLILANYLQQDAEFDGYEIEFGNTIMLLSGELTFSFGRDDLSGEFSRGGNIPRLNPARNIFKLKYFKDDMSIGLNFKDVEKQNDIGANEIVTPGYQMFNANLTKSINLGNEGELTLTFFGNNLLDELARNHSSFVKSQVPLPGRNYGLKFNFKFN